MHPAAIEAMTAVLADCGNASSLHTAGRAARRRVEESRETIAEKLGARPSEVILTAGGTESDNIAVKGIYWARRDADPCRRRIVTSAVEHHAVLDSVEWLADHEGAEVTSLPTNSDGTVSPGALRDALQEHDDVALVSIMWANNEVGAIMPITELTAVAAEFNVPVHSDAIQAVGQRLVGNERGSAQVRRPHRCRSAADAAGDRLRPAAARRGPGARRSVRHNRCGRSGRHGSRRAAGGGQYGCPQREAA
jgi:cysteine desulfurase